MFLIDMYFFIITCVFLSTGVCALITVVRLIKSSTTAWFQYHITQSTHILPLVGINLLSHKCISNFNWITAPILYL